MCNLHGDGFTTARPRTGLDWFEDGIEARYGLSARGQLGPGKSDSHEGLLPNRIVRWTPEGVEYVSDPGQFGRFTTDLDHHCDSQSAFAPRLKPLAQPIED